MTKLISILAILGFILFGSIGPALANDPLRSAAVRSLTNATGIRLNERQVIRRGNEYVTRRRDAHGQPLGRVPIVSQNEQGSARPTLGRAESRNWIEVPSNGQNVPFRMAPVDHALAQTRPFAGRKVVVLVESQFVPQELEVYRQRFEAYGAEVVFATRLWGNESLTFHSHVDQDVVPNVRWMTVEHDVGEFDLDAGEVAAVIQPVHTQQRLLYHHTTQGGANPLENTRQAPAVQLVERALRNPNVVVGAHGHGIEILAPLGEVVQGARITGSPGSLVHATNAGARYVPPAPGTNGAQHVVTEVDTDRVRGLNLVTGTSVTNGGTEAFVDAIARRVEAIARERN